MSELDKEYTPDASENTEAVEAFEDFEISADGEADSADVPEEIEEAGEADSADVPEEVEEAEEADSADVPEEIEEVEEAEVSDEMFELFGNTDEVEEIGNASAAYAAFNAADDSGESEIDEDDYLDYDDTPRPKKIISGKTALITMLVTGFVTIGIIVTAVWLVFTTQKAMDISVVSFSDNFNACDTKQFSLGQFLGLELVSMSDADCTLSEQDIKDLSRGKTVSKFGDLVGITAKTRFGKIVSMDIEFEKALDKLDQPGAQYIVLLGNIMSGFKNDAHTSDEAFLIAYQLFNTRSRADNMGEDFNVSYLDDIAVYFDYSRISETQLFSDLAIHIENRNPRFVDPEKLDFSWLPFDFSSKDDADDVSASDIEVSQSDR